MLVFPAIARADDDSVKVHVTGDPALVVERRIEGTELWESVCTGACDAQLPRSGMYRLTGRGLRPSLPIALIAVDDKVRLSASPGYSVAYSGGIVLTVVGPLVMLGGAVAAGVGGNQQGQFNCDFGGSCVTAPQSHALVIGGVISVVTGGVMMAAGIVAILLADHTHVHQIAKLTGRGLTVTF